MGIIESNYVQASECLLTLTHAPDVKLKFAKERLVYYTLHPILHHEPQWPAYSPCNLTKFLS